LGGILADNSGTGKPPKITAKSINNLPLYSRSIKNIWTFHSSTSLNTIYASFDADTDGLILMDCTDTIGSVGLPFPGSSSDYGKLFTVMRVDDNLGAYCYVRAIGGGSIEGFGTDVYLNTQYECTTFMSTANGYRMIERRAIKPSQLTTTARDAMSTPETGMIVFNSTTSSLNYWDGTVWKDLDSPPPPALFYLFYSEADMGIALPSRVSSSGGAYTVGTRFNTTKNDVVINGIRFYWGSSNQTVKCSLWDKDGNRIISANVTTTGTDIYTATFSSPQTLNPFAYYYITVYSTTGSIYYYMPNTGPISDLGLTAANWNNALHGDGYLRHNGVYTGSAVDDFPTGINTTALYMVEPVLGQ